MKTTCKRIPWILLVSTNNIQIWEFKMTTENLQEFVSQVQKACHFKNWFVHILLFVY